MLVAENEKYRLRVEIDHDAQDPREDYDNFGTMVCFHRRYDLGDNHSYSNPSDFLVDMASEHAREELEKKAYELYYIGPDEENEGCFAIYQKTDRKYWENDFIRVDGFDSKEDAEDVLEDYVDDFIDDPETVTEEELAKMVMCSPELVVLPVMMYDHGNIELSTSSPFNDRWDAGQVGIIYATKEQVEKEFGEWSDETREKARKLLDAEVRTYSHYVNGEVYGFILEEKKSCDSCGNVEYEQVDSCWGFLGDDWKEEIRYCLPEEAKHLLDELRGENYLVY